MDGVEPTGDERAFRVLLRGIFTVFEELQVLCVDPQPLPTPEHTLSTLAVHPQVLYVDLALPGELRLEWGRLEVQMSESTETLDSGLPLLGKVPSPGPSP